MFKKSEIWLILLLLLSGKAFTQTAVLVNKPEKITKPTIIVPAAPGFWQEGNTKKSGTAPAYFPVYRSFSIPKNHFHTQLGIICKKEWQVEQITKLPLRLRLGSLQYTNYLEGK